MKQFLSGNNSLFVFLALGLVFTGIFNFEIYAQTASEKQTYKFINGNWFDGKIFNRRIYYSVNGILTLKAPKQVDRTFDLENGYIIPPFAEAHSHKLDRQSELAEQESRFIKEGTMYVMVLTNGANNAVANRVLFNKSGELDVLYANGGITCTGQHPSFAYERIASGITDWYLPQNTKIIQASRREENNSYWFFDTIEDVEKKWNAYLASKPDIVKIYLLDAKNNAAVQKSISEEVAAYVVKKAHAAGLRIAAHIETFDDLKIGIKIGVDIFAHSPHYNLFFSQTEPLQPVFTNRELKIIRHRKLVLIPTLSLNEEFAIVRNAANNYQGSFDEKRFKEVIEFQKKTVQSLKDAGFTFAAGSDRDSVIPELDYWVKNNIFDKNFTLQTATVTTPQIMYPKRKLASLKTGYEASFLVLAGNPLENWNEIKNIKRRFKNGFLLDKLS